MKLRTSCLIALTVLMVVCGSVSVGQDKRGRPLEPVDAGRLWHSLPGMVPEHTTVYDTLVAHVIQQICLDSLVSYVRVLSGEDTATVGGSKVLLRERGSQVGGDLAAEYLKQRLASYNLEVFDQKYSPTGRNIYGKRMGYLFPEKEYIICAHYDAVDAYCADDNASGVAGVLEAARVLAQYDPKYTVVYAFWDEEEQGLVGSQYYASQVSPDQEQILGVIDMDMIGWDGNGDYLADIHTRNTANSNDLATLLVIVNYLYDLPIQPVIYNPGTWQSDHSSFWNHNYGAVLLIEAYYGGDLNPFYHGPDDRIARFHLPYFHGMSKLSTGALATLLELATGPLIASITPAVGYQSYATELHIKGVKTHFQENPAETRAWLSKDQQTLTPDSLRIINNTMLHAYFSIPLTTLLGSWDVEVKTAAEGLLTQLGGFSILPAPAVIAVAPESLTVALVHGETKESILTISNVGSMDLYFAASRFGSGGALQFDGIDDMVQGPTRGFPSGNADRTIELWFNRESQPWPEATLFGYGNWGVEDQVCEMFLNPNHLSFSAWCRFSFDGYAVVQSHCWQHFAVATDGNDATLYLNGQADRTLSGYIATVSTGSFVMGKAPSGYDDVRRFNGVIDEVRMWDYARTAAEITADMGRELSGTEPGLVGYWQFNETSGLTAYDLSPNANHGSLIGGPVWVSSSAPIAPSWIMIRPDSGVCPTQSSVILVVSIDATRLDEGTYHTAFRISTNDPFHPAVTVPIHVEVSSASTVGSQAEIPTVFNLHQNYPNPFNPSTSITYELPKASHVTLMVYDALGQKVATLVNESRPAGVHMAQFDAGRLASGVYLCQLHAGDYVATKRMLVLR